MDATPPAGSRDACTAGWALLRACAALGAAAGDAVAFSVDGDRVRRVAAGDRSAVVWRAAGAEWVAAPALPPALADLLALYLPLLAPRPLVVAHLGQSLDGFVATAAGDSAFVNDAANIVHLHRMRALCDAVVVGAATVRDDDPRLTTRRVPGPNPVRVIIDPRRELDPRATVFRDGDAPTLRVSTVAVPAHDAAGLRVAEDADGRPDLRDLLRALRERGMQRVFVEGGGVTVSRFVEAGLVDRLQVTVAPFLIGNGRPGLRLPGSDLLSERPRPRHRVFRMGADVLFDLELHVPAAARGDDSDAAPSAL